jgi:phosphatidylglycerol---prolipoprotein diacylglyceryl transferase
VLQLDREAGMTPDDLYPGWGIRPVLFRVAGLPVPAYEVFVLLGLLTGALVFWRLRRGEPRMGEPTAIIALAALAGGALGAKLLEWAFNWPALARVDSLSALLAGRTIIGGFLGGSISVVLVKRHYGIRERRGNLFAPAIALGLAVGRLGCFFRGCCYGEATTGPWGVDFGDHVMRHPTQLYESAFALLLFAVLLRLRARVTTPGRLLTVFMVAYFAFRFGEEFLRAGDRVALGLTLYQFAALAALGYFIARDRLVLNRQVTQAQETS